MKHILLTCDTEVGELSLSVPDAFDLFIEGKLDGQEVGYRFINRIAERYGAAVQHFVDIYPYEHFGESKFARLCQELLDQGHGLALHTHPSGRYDPRRKFMYQYSLEEQMDIVGYGKAKIYEWTGHEVTAHRAGAYGMNRETLTALAAHGISVDASYYHAHPHCRFAGSKKNEPFLSEGVLEIPISVYHKVTRYVPFPITRVIVTKLDFRYGSSAADIIACINQAPADSLIVLFLHSFNFLSLKYNFRQGRYKSIFIDRKLIEDYERLLASVRDDKGCTFTTIREVGGASLCREYEDFMPAVESSEPVFRSIGKKVRELFSAADVCV